MTLKKRRRICNSVICIGFVIALVALYFNHGHQDSAVPAMVLGSSLIFFGFCYYLWSKGYNPVLAFLFFFIGPIAFIVFWMLPDKNKEFGQIEQPH
jgi:Flp pilus assembly protein protease CpaA